MMDDPIQIAAKDLAATKNVSALTGPGISVERRLPPSGGKVIEINPERTPLSEETSDYIIMGKAGEDIKRLTAEIERLKNLNHT